MKIEWIIRELEAQFPLNLAMSWDNPGLQVGHPDRETGMAVVALDATNEVIQSCIGCGAKLLITHHPLLLSGIRQVNDDSMYGRKILALAEHGIAHYAMHTNYDIAKMAELAEQALQLLACSPLEETGVLEDGTACGIGRIGMLPEAMTAGACCALVKQVFGLDSVRLFGSAERLIRRVAVCPGSGKSVIPEAQKKGADLLITGDIGHHDGLDALDQGLLVMDAGHYGIEQIFIPQVAAFLSGRFPELAVKQIRSGAPFATL